MKYKIKNTYTIKKEIDFYVYIKVEASSEEEAHEKANECTIRCPVDEAYEVEEVSFKEYYGTTDITLDKEEFLCPINDMWYHKADGVLVTHKGKTIKISEDAWYDVQFDPNEDYERVDS